MEPIKLSEDGSVILPQPEEIQQKEKSDAMGAYLMMFAAWAVSLPIPFVNLLAAIIYYFINKKVSRFVAFNSHQSLITQLLVSIFNAAGLFWGIRILIIYAIKKSASAWNGLFIFSGYLLFVILWNLIYTIYSLIACYYASKGRFFYMFLFGRLSFNKFYGKKAQENIKKVVTNAPPSGY
ncbi:MAG: DUF4870 domain-containing protein [Spirochaetes bacterium]|nr:DUF4870 domain-containing protein [Spirochaetota bacterium]